MSESFLATEVASQPACWRAAATLAPEVAGVLPRAGERVAVIGCGTSLFMAQAYAGLREAVGEGLTDAWPASEHRLERGYDRLVVISRSGTTTEIVTLLEANAGRIPATVITADASSPATSLAEPLVLTHADERSVVQSRFATSALALLRASLGDDLGPVADEAERVLQLPYAELGPAATAEQVTFLGRAWTVGLAHEAALKLREATRTWAESYPAMEYRHGPISIAEPGRVVWALGALPDGLATEVAATGAAFDHAARDPLADLVRVHRVCLARAAAAGLDPDSPRSLRRAVILDAAP